MNIVDALTPVNHWTGRGGRAIRAIVIHITDGPDAESAVGWFHNPASEVSAHYVIGLDGAIYRIVAEADGAWANGRLNKPDMNNPIVASWVRDGINPNLETISIEMAGHPASTKPAAQWASVLWLVADIRRRRGIVADRTHTIGHYQIDSVTRARCPSLTDAQWGELTMPDPQFNVGAGIRAAMDRAHDEPRSDEEYVHTSDGRDICSIAFGRDGAYIYSPKTDSVYRVQRA